MKINRRHATDTTDVTEITDATCELAVPHDRYSVAFQVTTCQMWVVDSTGRDQPRGPFLSCRHAWELAINLNFDNKTRTSTGCGES